jgi:hypothetical protein
LRVDVDFVGELPTWVRWIASDHVVAVGADLRRVYTGAA